MATKAAPPWVHKARKKRKMLKRELKKACSRRKRRKLKLKRRKLKRKIKRTGYLVKAPC
ncbi:MAG: hypothetical protein ABIH21_05210 [Patescibacteria group bacterium]